MKSDLMKSSEFEEVQDRKESRDPFEEKLSIGPLLDALDVPAAYISFRNGGSESFGALEGVDREVLEEQVMKIRNCLKGKKYLEVGDLSRDNGSKVSAWLMNGIRFRSLLAVPIKEENGEQVGTLCVLDSRPRRFEERDIDLLNQQARLSSTYLDIHPLRGMGRTSKMEMEQEALALEKGASKRSGKALHDDVVQPLAAGKMFLEALRSREPSEGEDSSSDASYIEELRKILQNSLEQARKISQDLQFQPEDHPLEEIVNRNIGSYRRGNFKIALESEFQETEVDPLRKRSIHNILHRILDSFDRICREEVRIELRVRSGLFSLTARSEEKKGSREAISSLADPLSCLEFIGGYSQVSETSEGGSVLNVGIPLLAKEPEELRRPSSG